MFIHNKTNNVNLYESILHREHSTQRFTIYTRYILIGVFSVSKQPIQNTFRSVKNYFHFLRIKRWKNLLWHGSPLLTRASIWPWETFDWVGTNIWTTCLHRNGLRHGDEKNHVFSHLSTLVLSFLGTNLLPQPSWPPTGPDPDLPSSDSPSHSLF